MGRHPERLHQPLLAMAPKQQQQPRPREKPELTGHYKRPISYPLRLQSKFQCFCFCFEKVVSILLMLAPVQIRTRRSRPTSHSSCCWVLAWTPTTMYNGRRSATCTWLDQLAQSDPNHHDAHQNDMIISRRLRCAAAMDASHKCILLDPGSATMSYAVVSTTVSALPQPQVLGRCCVTVVCSLHHNHGGGGVLLRLQPY